MAKIKKSTTMILTVVAVIAIGLTVINLVLLQKNDQRDIDSDLGDVDLSLIDDDPSIGEESAYVTIVEFSDYQCPVCKRFHDDIYVEMKQKYIDTGKVRFVYRDFPLPPRMHPFAQKSAEAGECAHDQGKFWEYSDLLFANSPKLDRGSLIEYAKQVSGVDIAEFTMCLDSGKHSSEVNSDLQDGISRGISGTPTLFVNGKILQGLPDKNQFFAMIEKEIIRVRSSRPK